MRFKDYLVAGVLGVASLLSPRVVHADESPKKETPSLEKIVEDYSALYEEVKNPVSSDPAVAIKSLKYGGISRGITRIWAEVVEGYVNEEMRIEDFPYKGGRKQEWHVTRSRWDKAPEIKEPDFLKKVDKMDYIVYTKADGSKEESLEVNGFEGTSFVYMPSLSSADPEGSSVKPQEKQKEEPRRFFGRVSKEEAPQLYEHAAKELSRFSGLLELPKYIEKTKSHVKSVEPLLATFPKDFNLEDYQRRDSSEILELRSRENLTPSTIILDKAEPQTFVPRHSWYGSFMIRAKYGIIQKDGKRGILEIDLNDIDADGNLDMIVFDEGNGLDFTMNHDGSVKIDGPFDERYSQEEGRKVISRGQEIYRSLLRDPKIRKNLLDTRDKLNKEVERNLPEPFPK